MTTTNTSSSVPFSISHVFSAPRAKVFAVHTTAEHLQKWLSPEGCDTTYAKMDFRVGGSYHYCNEVPNGLQMWGKQTFRDILPNEKLTYLQTFSDKDGGIGKHPMAPTWPAEILATITFEDAGAGHTKVTTTWQPLNTDEAGNAAFDAARGSMTQGFGSVFVKLDGYLQSL